MAFSVESDAGVSLADAILLYGDLSERERADVAVLLVVIGEVVTREGAIATLRFVEDRNVRFDPAFVNQPTEHFGRSIGGVGGHSLGIEAELILDPVDHCACGAYLRLPDRAASLDINDDGVFEVDQVVGGIGKEGMALERACPLRGRV